MISSRVFIVIVHSVTYFKKFGTNSKKEEARERDTQKKKEKREDEVRKALREKPRLKFVQLCDEFSLDEINLRF